MTIQQGNQASRIPGTLPRPVPSGNPRSSLNITHLARIFGRDANATAMCYAVLYAQDPTDISVIEDIYETPSSPRLDAQRGVPSLSVLI